MKVAPIVRELKAWKEGAVDWKLIHTGQHYDYEMSQAFFDDLEIPKPDYFLDAGSGSHAVQTAKIMVRFERVCADEKPDLVMVVGDVNSTLACSVVAKKLLIHVAHVEAGLRSFDLAMPEEINRMVTDSISDYLFVTEKSGIENLRREGRTDDQIFFVGNVMIDTLHYHLQKLTNSSNSATGCGVNKKRRPYAVTTLHRPSNVDDRIIFTGILEALGQIAEDMPVIFPTHPRTKRSIAQFELSRFIKRSRIELIDPLPYLAFLGLWKDASLVVTDSGGLQEETTALGIPCFTIRENTERPITVEEGSNTLVGTMFSEILAAYERFKKGEVKKGRIPELWDGRASRRILAALTSPTILKTLKAA
jgi:UDP-N-acetylglucosamine 2-epimerase (non-hydrolysing)